MGKEYVGTIILTISGVEVECKSVKPSRKHNRKAVNTMNSEGKAKGKTHGVPEYTLTVQAPVQPRGLDIDWDNVEDALLSIFDRKGGLLEQYYDVTTTEVGVSYEVEGEAMHDVSMFALDYKRFGRLTRV